MPITLPNGTAMIVFIGIDGTVLDVTDKDGKPAEKKDPIALKKPINLKKLHPCVSLAWEGSNCVTYYYPGGSRTVCW
jgi:hypothetical protein